ncbi:two-component system, OmpR family, phosphate regulon sensor histidine kinase PhoR [Halobacillus dabanensis]|uniref:histidine kinase n=1 Tax=Halobacillus dabanensis TaxID=240302 RepID=A0A1I3NUT0_HALDA|nr:ATP-binding protein [Halobacillus dabanensis]SFJ13033.1 two-component system, OmpR family, phosphate regulon sensor histidine kinase PhoR [Halobacillus dabanensis]
MSSNTKPLMTYTVLIVIVMLGLGIILAQLTRGYFINIFEQRIELESQYFVTFLERFKEDRDISKEELYNFSEQLNTGMVFISASGERVIDTVEAIPVIDEKEVQEVISRVTNGPESYGEGQMIDNIFYYSVNEEVIDIDGSLILISPVNALTNITKNIWLLIGFTLLLGLIIIFVIGYNIFSKYIRPIRSATNVATELARGNYKARTYEGHFGEAGQLSQSINILARNLQEMTSSKGMQENQLEAVINNMGNGLVLIDERGYIVLLNRAFFETFGGQQKDYIGYLYHDVIPYTAIHETVQKIYMFEETVSENFVLPVNINQKHLEVTGAPIFSEEKRWKGVVLVFHDITELKHLEQMRKDFVANVSHELKTPITSIRGFSETLLDGAMKDEKMLEQFLHIILRESGRLQSLIQDLLELSKVEREDFNMNVEEIDVQRLLNDLLPIVKQHADKKQVQLSAFIEGVTIIQGDSSRLKQVFMNLLTNAINYSEENGKVGIHFQESKDYVTVSITDNGVGIPEEEVPRIFERFYRVDKARSRNSGGTGLGLAIVKHIVEAHHGTVRVESVIDKGTSFHVEIPKKFTEN